MAKAPTAQTWGLTLLAASEVPNFYSAPLPSMFTIRRFGARDIREETTEDIRRGELIATVEAALLGVATSIVAESWWPLLAVGIMAWIQVKGIYEWSLANPHPTAEPMV